MMIRFDAGLDCFNYRIVGVAMHEGAVLLHQAAGDDFWTFPGGRAELGEPAEQTLKREMREEIDTEIEIVRLLWFVENFYTYAEKRYHEIALYFLMRLPAACPYLTQPTFQAEDAGTQLTFRWFAAQPDVLAALPLLPSFIPTALQELPASVQHITHYD